MRKKKTRLFKWKVVEAYRAERVQVSELEERLGISKTELRRLNHWYYRFRLLPLLHPKNRRRTMKRDADYVKMLERKLTDMDRGVQYCSWAYVQRLRQSNATISMTESGDPTGSPER